MSTYRRFADSSVSEKILDTMFLLTIGLGYLFALTHTFYSHEDRDGEPGLSVEDIKIAYYGEHQQTKLGASLNGSMARNLDYPEQKQIIFDWIKGGSDEATFNDQVLPIMLNNCVECHSTDVNTGLPPLEYYQEVLVMTQTDEGASIQSLVRVSHIHLFGIAFILLFVGRIFILCEMPVTLKRVTVAIPFIAILLDILSWYATKAFPGFAYVVVFTGALMGISLAVQIIVSMYQMWLFKPKTVQHERPKNPSNHTVQYNSCRSL